MATITKKELIDRIAESEGHRRVQVKKVVQKFLDEIVNETRQRQSPRVPRFRGIRDQAAQGAKAQNPKTLEPVAVPEKRTVKFKVGRLMKQKLGDLTGAAIDDEAGDIDEMNDISAADDDGAEEGHHAGEAGHASGANAATHSEGGGAHS